MVVATVTTNLSWAITQLSVQLFNSIIQLGSRIVALLEPLSLGDIMRQALQAEPATSALSTDDLNEVRGHLRTYYGLTDLDIHELIQGYETVSRVLRTIHEMKRSSLRIIR